MLCVGAFALDLVELLHCRSAERGVIGLLEQILVVRFDFQLRTRAQSALSRLMDWSRDGESWHTLTPWTLLASWPKIHPGFAMYSVCVSVLFSLDLSVCIGI
jgi:hypothetical protein